MRKRLAVGGRGSIKRQQDIEFCFYLLYYKKPSRIFLGSLFKNLKSALIVSTFGFFIITMCCFLFFVSKCLQYIFLCKSHFKHQQERVFFIFKTHIVAHTVKPVMVVLYSRQLTVATKYFYLIKVGLQRYFGKLNDFRKYKKNLMVALTFIRKSILLEKTLNKMTNNQLFKAI